MPELYIVARGEIEKFIKEHPDLYIAVDEYGFSIHQFDNGDTSASHPLVEHIDNTHQLLGRIRNHA